MPGPPRPARASIAAVLVALCVMSALAFVPGAGAAAGTAVWTPVTSRLDATERTVHPAEYRAYAVDEAALVAAADRGRVELPDPTGELVAFRVRETSVLEPALAARHPELRTWSGTALDGAATVSLDITPAGVHAAVLGDGPAWYVDPAYRTDSGTHLTYRGADLPAPDRPLVEPRLSKDDQQRIARRAATADAGGGPVELHTYRLALLSDPSYAAAVAPDPASEADSDARVLAAKTTLVNRLDQLYGTDLGIRFTLVGATESALNLWTAAEATQPGGACGGVACFTAAQLTSCTVDTLGRMRWVVGQLVGSRNYDVGHLALGRAGGGLANVGVVGLDGLHSKAAGCTGLSAPTGDAYAVDYLAHELGHQFGATHTFDGCGGSDVASAAVEPGSGSTIMGYAGICGADNLQAHSDPVFSEASRDQVAAYVGSGSVITQEVQSVSLRDFDAGDSFRLAWGGAQSGVIALGSTYSVSGIKTAVAATGRTLANVAPYFTTDYAAIDATGFSLVYPYGTGDVPEPTVVPVSGSFTATVRDIDQGTDGATVTSGGAVTTPGNHAPTVAAPADATIPMRTPFVLTGSGADADGDAVRYLWEQTDFAADGQRPLATQPKTDGPLFRVFGTASDTFANAPGDSPSRSFPDLTQVLAGDTNADTGGCTSRDCLSEWLPTAAYAGSALHFRLTARDGAPEGGGAASDDVTLTLDKTAGPLRVTSQATPGTTLEGGSTQTVTWDVNATDRPALAPQVRLRLSTDGGATWSTLVETTPNDGSEAVVLPRVSAAAARLRVEAAGNYFYDVNAAPFAIHVGGGPAPLVVTTPLAALVPVQFSDRPDATFAASSGVLAPTATATGLPAGLSLARSVAGQTATWSFAGAVTATPGSYPVHVSVTDGASTLALTTTVAVAPEDATVAYAGDAAHLLRAQVTGAADGSPGPLTGATVTFSEAGTALCSAAVTALGTASCPAALAPGTHPVSMAVSGTYVGAAGPVAVTVAAPPVSPPPAPDTTITGGPTGWLPAPTATFSFASSASGSAFSCLLDGTPVACAGPSVTLTALSPGSHRFAVAAAGDETPAVRDVAVPVDDTSLTTTGRWKRKKLASAYAGTVAETRRKGAALSYQVAGARELALLVRTGKRYGKVKVYLGGQLLATVRTAGPSGARTISLGSFAQPRSGQLRIVSASDRRVRIDGLGVSSTAF